MEVELALRLQSGRNIAPGAVMRAYLSAEKSVGARSWLEMFATIGPLRSLSSRTLCQAGSFRNAVHLISRSARDSHWRMYVSSLLDSPTRVVQNPTGRIPCCSQIGRSWSLK